MIVLELIDRKNRKTESRKLKFTFNRENAGPGVRDQSSEVEN